MRGQRRCEVWEEVVSRRWLGGGAAARRGRKTSVRAFFPAVAKSKKVCVRSQKAKKQVPPGIFPASTHFQRRLLYGRRRGKFRKSGDTLKVAGGRIFLEHPFACR